MLELTEDERELLQPEVDAALAEARAESRRVQYGELRTAIEAGRIPSDLEPILLPLLEVGLESGRFRRLYSVEDETIARRLFMRTARGAELRESARSATQALAALRGAELHRLEIAPAGPGSYTLEIATSRGVVRLALEREGVQVRSVEV